MYYILSLTLSFVLLSACTTTKTTSSTTVVHDNNTMTLFDGKTMTGWRTYQNKPADSWSVKDGVLYCKGSTTDKSDRRADLITNLTRIVVKNGEVEHWLNGVRLLKYELGSADWNTRKANGKWKDTPSYGTLRKGHIALQDHGSEAWFRNIKLKKL